MSCDVLSTTGGNAEGGSRNKRGIFGIITGVAKFSYERSHTLSYCLNSPVAFKNGRMQPCESSTYICCLDLLEDELTANHLELSMKKMGGSFLFSDTIFKDKVSVLRQEF